MMRISHIAIAGALTMLALSFSPLAANAATAQKCTTTYEHTMTPASNTGRSTQSAVTREEVDCTQPWSGPLTVTVKTSGGKEKNVTVSLVSASVTGKVPFSKNVKLTQKVNYAAQAYIVISGDVPYSTLPKITVSKS